MEALETIPHRHDDKAALGEGLRKLHEMRGDEHGWVRDNACYVQGLLDHGLRQRIETLAHGLERWLPDVSPRLVHGDLWSGNRLCTTQGHAIIDSAVYRHYPEVYLSMLMLFCSPSSAFFEAYWSDSAPDDWPWREALFHLYPLLNHLLLFGECYRALVERTVSRLEAY